MTNESINTKSEILNSKQNPMPQIPNSKLKKYDLEERTQRFAQRVIGYVDVLPKSLANIEISKQLIRSGGSIGANYIEANEALGKKDFIMKVKTCKREAKESRYWLRLSQSFEGDISRKDGLIREATELMKIFGSIIARSI
jgi:four helix bundle protein